MTQPIYKTVGRESPPRYKVRYRKFRERLRKLYCQAVSKKYVRSDYGVKMQANWHDATFNYCINANYGYFYCEYLRNLSAPFCFLDIGSNQGLYSLIAAKNSHCGSVWAFEPVDNTFRVLADNIVANELDSRITPVRSAISSSSGFAKINIKKGHSGGASLCQLNDLSGVLNEDVRLMTSSDLNGMIKGDDQIVVKIDVEGHEDVVIQEILKCSFRARIHSIYYEMDERWNDPEVVESTLFKSGFQCFTKVMGGKDFHYDVLASLNTPK